MSTPECTCIVTLESIDPEHGEATVVFSMCPLHKAAPELLEACEMADDIFSQMDIGDEYAMRVDQSIKAAIAKAKEAS